jgi:hypothetical protein
MRIPRLNRARAVGGKKLTADSDGGNRSSSGGVTLLREAERKLGLLRVGHGWTRAYAVVKYEQAVEPFLKTAV